MTYTILVSVTHEDILYGLQSNCRECPVAKALHRAFIPFVTLDGVKWYPHDVTVGRLTACVRAWSDIALAGADLPEHIKGFITNFDRSGGLGIMPPEPFNLTFKFDEHNHAKLEFNL